MALNAEYIQKEVEELSEKCATSSRIDPALYTKYDVKKGLRDLNGKGLRKFPKSTRRRKWTASRCLRTASSSTAATT